MVHLKGLPLHHAPANEVMLLIGQDYPDALVPSPPCPERKGALCVRTRLGWTVNGPVAKQQGAGGSASLLHSGRAIRAAQSELERFRKLKSSGLYEDDRAMSVQDKLVTARWEETVVYDDGHCTLPIPFDTRSHGHQITGGWAETCLNLLCEKLEEDAKPSEEFMEGTQDPCGGMIAWD